ncbi:unnamed protein product [Lathyrus sativus]|nr:unnamed protein product [Lathyrus sativus]CAK8076152.1 unnamed protein product [Lathyrus sativus]
MSHSIFHQTLLCQTQSVAEYQSKLNSCGIVSGTLFQSQSVDKEKKLLLSTNFRGSRLCVRKRRVAMAKNHSISRAVLTSNAASELSEKFNLEGNIEMQVNLSFSGSGECNITN